LIFAALIFLSFFIGVPYFARKHWTEIMELKDYYGITYNMMYLGINIMMHNIIHLGANLVYWVFYHYEFPFIERYKSNEESWPWHQDPQGWRKLVKKSVLVLLFNGNVLALMVYLPLTRTGLIEEHSLE
jgi:hypothetical protein